MTEQQAPYTTLITPLQAAELMLADDRSKDCHLEPRLRDALERELMMLRDDKAQMFEWKIKYLALARERRELITWLDKEIQAANRAAIIALESSEDDSEMEFDHFNGRNLALQSVRERMVAGI